ncbi:hypothetical protein JKP88DRAFT_313973 [Tribonema minus]|uniref:Uncharacterized protein n=1 Tax=Tribonema minus TaxID=303371 RepID=A0A836CGK6_9STRA|nr:hypothetical protein JKP88DRAFT_313973 [Tribonema minus]
MASAARQSEGSASPLVRTAVNNAAAQSSPASEREALLARKEKLQLQQQSAAGQQKGVPRSPYGSLAKAKAKELEDDAKDDSGRMLVLAFVTMLFVGTGNRIFMKLQTIPMYNYPFTMNLLTTFIYIPVCFAYILPMQWFGSAITAEQRAIPRHKFAVMGLLDAVAGIMGTFAVNYITNASMIVLLQQAAIPISMVISRMFLGARYSVYQYIGATVVIAGIIVTMIPTFLGGGDAAGGADSGTQIVWSIVQVLSCIPMCLSSVYKEKALGELDIDVVFLNGWVAVYQFLASVVFAAPSAYAMGLPLAELPENTYSGWLCFLGQNTALPSMAEGAYAMGLPLAELPENTYSGWLCFLGQNTALPSMAEGETMSMPHMDHCELAPLFVTTYLVFNIAYNVVLIVILKYGSANVLWLASTVMVPIGNVAFSLHFVPGHQDLRPADMGGLALILGGLLVYRFTAPLLAWLQRVSGGAAALPAADEVEAGRRVALVARGVTRSNAKYVGLNQAEYLEPVIETRVWRAQRARLARSPEQAKHLEPVIETRVLLLLLCLCAVLML